MDESPFISVIITAHDRKEFLLDAVNSALKQTLDRSLYEIIVVKNFNDFTIDRFLENNGVHKIIINSDSGGEKFVAGIGKSKGEIISFLDDDDTFLEDKLERVREAFSNGNLGFFHNGLNIVDSAGNPLKMNVLSFPKTPLIVKDRLAGDSIGILLKKGAWFNSSSISVRKEILASRVNYLARINAVTDSFLFYAALLTNFTIRLDPEPLTTYMVHNSLSNFAGDFEKFVPAKTFLYHRSLKDFSVISEMLRNSPYQEYSKAEKSRVRFELSIIADYHDARPNIIDFMHVLKKPCHLKLTGSLSIIIAYIFSIFSRNKAVRMFYSFENEKFKKP